MGSVTGITAARAQEIADAVLETAGLDGSGHLVLTRHNGSTLVLDQVAEDAFAQTPSRVLLKAFDATDEEVIVPEWSIDGMANERFTPASPSAIPDSAKGVSWSQDGKYLAITTDISPYLDVWKRSTTDGEDFTTLGMPDATPPLGLGGKPSWSSTGKYLAVPYASGLYVYMRVGVNTFSKMTDPPSYPGGAGIGAGWSTDETYLAVTTATSPYFAIYKRSGSTFSKLTDPAAMPPGSPGKPAFSNSGTYLAVPHQTSPFITIYKRSGDVFTKLTNPGTLPPAQARSVSWSPDDQYLAVGHGTTPYFTVYKRNGDTFTKIADPKVLPGSTTYSIAWSPDGKYLAVGANLAPWIFVYQRIKDELRLLPPVDVPPTALVTDLAWSPAGLALAATISAASGSSFRMYRSSMAQPAGLAVAPTLVP